ncbi:MAG: MFS transporter [Bacteroidetes bacterium]|nr:MFS transporter [Bacteroidota bacterium]
MMDTTIAAIQEKPKKPALLLYTAFLICFLSIFFGGITSMLMSVYLPVAVKDLLGAVEGPRFESISAYINSIFIFGCMFGGLSWGFIADRIGRSKSVILSTACCGLFTLLTAFSSSWLVVSLYRFFTGFGVGGILLTTNILIAELWTEKNKAVALGIVGVGMPIGFVFAGMMNNLVSNWHYAFATGAIPLLVAGVATIVLAEPDQWKDRKTESAIDKKLFTASNREALVTGSLIYGTMLIGLWAIFSWAPTWVQSITDAASAQQQRGMAMMILAGGGIIGSCLSGWIVGGIGLRKTMLLCFAGCFVMTFVVFKLNSSIQPGTFIEMAGLAFFFGISQGALSVYIPELFPTIIRASATGFCFNIGRLFTGSVVFFIGALESFLGGYGNAVFIFSFIFLVGLAVTFLSKKR